MHDAPAINKKLEVEAKREKAKSLAKKLEILTEQEQDIKDKYGYDNKLVR